MEIGRAVVYFARAAHKFNAGIKCRQCRSQQTYTGLFFQQARNLPVTVMLHARYKSFKSTGPFELGLLIHHLINKCIIVGFVSYGIRVVMDPLF